eukprot:scaffold38760_cov58-Cyclotella_meneghiniana.AAC.1
MGGDSSKDKRKQQREAKRQAAAAAEAKQSSSNNPNDSNALVRLRRKLERKASGKFKLASVDKPKAQERQPQKRKSTEHTVPNKRPKKYGGQDNRTSSDKRNHSKNKPLIKKTKKNKDAKTKPKHLNRKVAQLSKSLEEGGGGSIADLEAQMNALKEQIELMKGMKNGKVTDVKTEHSEEKKNADTIENKEETKIKSPSSSSDSDDDSSTRNKNVNRPKEAVAKGECESSSSSGSSSESESEDEAVVKANTRSRGKRRRGRREKATDPEEDSTEFNEGKSSETQIDSTNKKTPKKDDTRHCIGRKPVTDYTVGNKYTGQVKYIKSTLGAFIDIGCHSDAFCHISCISDGYATTVEEVVNVGDQVEARVIEVNREKKRITVSLRSDEMAQIEVETLQSKQKRVPFKKTGVDSNEKKSSHLVYENNDSEVKNADVNKGSINTSYSNTNKREQTAESKKHVSNGVKTGADLKRERKLARRAERRAQMAAE